jgi:hypothetical protein
MEPIKVKEGFELELVEIEELETKIAPDASDAVLPLPGGGRCHR